MKTAILIVFSFISTTDAAVRQTPTTNGTARLMTSISTQTEVTVDAVAPVPVSTKFTQLSEENGSDAGESTSENGDVNTLKPPSNTSTPSKQKEPVAEENANLSASTTSQTSYTLSPHKSDNHTTTRTTEPSFNIAEVTALATLLSISMINERNTEASASLNNQTVSFTRDTQTSPSPAMPIATNGNHSTADSFNSNASGNGGETGNTSQSLASIHGASENVAVFSVSERVTPPDGFQDPLQPTTGTKDSKTTTKSPPSNTSEQAGETRGVTTDQTQTSLNEQNNLAAYEPGQANILAIHGQNPTGLNIPDADGGGGTDNTLGESDESLLSIANIDNLDAYISDENNAEPHAQEGASKSEKKSRRYKKKKNKKKMNIR